MSTHSIPISNDVNFLTPLTKREYFAAMAMQGLLASWTSNYQPPYPTKDRIPELVSVATQLSDELLQQLEKQ